MLQHEVDHHTGCGPVRAMLATSNSINWTKAHLLRPNTQFTKHFPLLEMAESRNWATSMKCLEGDHLMLDIQIFKAEDIISP